MLSAHFLQCLKGLSRDQSCPPSVHCACAGNKKNKKCKLILGHSAGKVENLFWIDLLLNKRVMLKHYTIFVKYFIHNFFCLTVFWESNPTITVPWLKSLDFSRLYSCNVDLLIYQYLDIIFFSC